MLSKHNSFTTESLINHEYLQLLAKQYPNIASVTSELINLQAILNLPKGTEHFLTDLHGEYDAFAYHLKTASGMISIKVEDVFGDRIDLKMKQTLTALTAYPKERLKIAQENHENNEQWYHQIIHYMINLCKAVTSKYTRSKVRKSMPKDFAYILDELLHIELTQLNQEDYYHQIIDYIIELERSDAFIIAIGQAIQRFLVDRLHIIGDIYDRGPYPHKIMDSLIEHHNVDIQWGNHDILWMGAANGHPLMVATVIRIALRYANLECLEEGYGINLLPLGQLAIESYHNDPCTEFMPKISAHQHSVGEKDRLFIARMHKAISIIQFKLEGELINRQKTFNMSDRDCLSNINFSTGYFNNAQGQWKMNSCFFPTIDPNHPLQLTDEEQSVIDKLVSYFINSEKLQKHIHFFYTNGALYLKCNGNLLIHGCLVVDDKGEYLPLTIGNENYYGHHMLDKLESLVRTARYSDNINDTDWLWYLWTGKLSPMFAKDKMATFERYFLTDKSQHKEKLNAFFQLREQAGICKKILTDFGLDPEHGHIISGHTPIKTIKGESPIKAEGKLLVIDGGLSKPYQSKTGIGGYTLIYNSWGLRLVSHKPFTSIENVLKNEGIGINKDIRVLKKTYRKRVANTEEGKEIQKQITILKKLLISYTQGVINEKHYF